MRTRCTLKYERSTDRGKSRNLAKGIEKVLDEWRSQRKGNPRAAESTSYGVGVLMYEVTRCAKTEVVVVLRKSCGAWATSPGCSALRSEDTTSR